MLPTWGLGVLDSPAGLALRARRDIRAGQQAGRLHAPGRRRRPQRRRRRPARAAAALPGLPGADERDDRRPARRGDPAPARRSRGGGRPARRAAGRRRWRLVAGDQPRCLPARAGAAQRLRPVIRLTTTVGTGFLHQRSKPVPVSAGWAVGGPPSYVGRAWSPRTIRGSPAIPSAGFAAPSPPGAGTRPRQDRHDHVRRAVAPFSARPSGRCGGRPTPAPGARPDFRPWPPHVRSGMVTSGGSR